MKTLRANDSNGVMVATLVVDGDTVKIDSKLPKVNGLIGKALKKRVSREMNGITADGFVLVKPGNPGYQDAVIDTLEGMGLDVVG